MRKCPLCQSTNTGASVKQHRQYTERGRLDIDYNRCHTCGAAWDSYDYPREDVTEIHDVRRGDGNLLAWGDLPSPRCRHCRGLDVKWLYEEGRWHAPGVGILRYECSRCGQIWQEMVRDTDGTRVARRVFRRGVLT